MTVAPTTTTTVVVPGTHLMAALVGPRDQHLRQIEEAFPTTEISVRGNEVQRRAARSPSQVGRLFEELVGLLQQGHQLDDTSLDRVMTMVGDDERPSEVLTHDVLRGAKGRQIRPKSAGQKRYIDAIEQNVITFGIGPAGTGKSWLAVAMAVKALQAKQVQRIILTRPAVEAGERLGFLPGDLMAKIDPYLRPLYDALYDMVDAEGAQRLLERQTVEVAPLAFMRGRTLNNCFIILDEAQNTTPEQMKMFLTRIGFGSQVVVTGDVTQVDVPERQERPRRPGTRCSHGIDGLAFVKLGAGRRRAPPDRRRHRRGLRARRGRGARPTRRQAMPSLRVPPSAPTPPRWWRRRRAVRRRRVDVDRWCRLGDRRPRDARARRGELTLTFVDRDEIAELNAEHLGQTGRPTCCRSRSTTTRRPGRPGVPVLLGDVVVCPAVAAEQAPTHAGTLDDELALLVVHGVLHVLGHDHAEPAESRAACGRASSRCSRPTTGTARRRPASVRSTT